MRPVLSVRIAPAMQTERNALLKAVLPARSGVNTHATLALEPVLELFVVYDADGTPAGELIYMTKKLLGLGHCAACDITHGPQREKPEFTQLKTAGWSVPLTNIHRDEMDASLALAVGHRLPCVAARTATSDILLLGQETLATCEGDVVRFQELVNLALRVHRLTAAPASLPHFPVPVLRIPVPTVVPRTWDWKDLCTVVHSRDEVDVVVLS